MPAGERPLCGVPASDARRPERSRSARGRFCLADGLALGQLSGMRNLARRILSWLAGSLLLAIVSGVVGEFFTALARENGWYQHPSERLDAAMNAFSSFVTHSSFLTATAGIVGLAVGMWMDTILRRSSLQRAPVNLSGQALAPEHEPSGKDESTVQAQYDLMLFTIDYIIPASRAQIDLQDAVIDLIAAGDRTMQWSIKQSIRSDASVTAFLASVEKLEGGLHSHPVHCPPFVDLMTQVDSIEKGYADFRKETDTLATGRGLEYSNHSMLNPLWRNWRQAHNNLVREYETIKRDRRFPKLFRPARPSRWGDPVPDKK
jgi:hypothetical protein